MGYMASPLGAYIVKGRGISLKLNKTRDENRMTRRFVRKSLRRTVSVYYL